VIESPEQARRLGVEPPSGLLLYGPPGTGKTSCIKAIANYLHRDVVMVKLNSFKTNTAFADIFTEHPSQISHRKKIFVFEEIDCCLQCLYKFLFSNTISGYGIIILGRTLIFYYSIMASLCSRKLFLISASVS
jgi:replication-associated recombination protein RarA